MFDIQMLSLDEATPSCPMPRAFSTRNVIYQASCPLRNLHYHAFKILNIEGPLRMTPAMDGGQYHNQKDLSDIRLWRH